MLSLGDHLQTVVAVHQGHLEHMLHLLFPTDDIHSNVRKGGRIRSSETGRLVELDLWVPSKDIAFEFQDEYHYTNTWDSQLPLSFVQQKDALKLAAVRRKRETLIVVPCWWDGSSESLMASICFSRPDISPGKPPPFLPIPLNTPADYFARGNIPDVGELMLASFPSDTEMYSTISPVNSWWLGEKYDGIRFCWHPVHKSIYSRSGIELAPLLSFLKYFPVLFLDGEIWFGRGCFHDVQRVVATSPSEQLEWQNMRLLAFDIPSPQTNLFSFEDRYDLLLSCVVHDHPFIINASRVMCSSNVYLVVTTNDIVKDGGEGVILRKPLSQYEKGRSNNLFKFKTTRGDKEALVLSVSPDQSCVLQMTDGRTVRAPCRAFPFGKGPKQGDVVTFEYDSFSRAGLPVIYRIRTDVEWEEIASQSVEQLNLNASSSKAMGREIIHGCYWPLEKMRGRRLFFEQFARLRNFDPLIASNWYRISRKAIEKTKGSSSVLGHYNGSIIKALLSLFPAIGLDKNKFSVLPNKHWLSVENRRKFFLDIARQKKFDPFVASNWHTIKREAVLQYKGGLSVLEFYHGSLKTALSSLFPEIRFGQGDFQTIQHDESARRDFFLAFAHQKQFDPLVPGNWYLNAGDILARKDARTILHHYNGDVIRALLRLFPQIGLNKDKLCTAYEMYWRGQLIEFSKVKSFDPLVPDNWYHMTREKELAFYNKETKEQLRFPRDLVIREAFNQFPYIGLEKNKFSFLSDKYNLDDSGRKKFFERVAKLMKFDPNIAENWYSVTRQDILHVKGASAVLRHYNGSYVKALTSLFPDLSLEDYRFVSLSRNHWSDPSKRRAFFDMFARKHHFDPLTLEEWDKVHIKEICAEKGGASVLKHYGFSLIRALTTLYHHHDDMTTSSSAARAPSNTLIRSRRKRMKSSTE